MKVNGILRDTYKVILAATFGAFLGSVIAAGVILVRQPTINASFDTRVSAQDVRITTVEVNQQRNSETLARIEGYVKGLAERFNVQPVLINK